MKFRFQSLLKVHELKETLLQRELAQIKRVLQLQQQQAENLKNTVEAREKDAQESLSRPMNIDTLNLYTNFFAGAKSEQARQEQIFKEIEMRLNEKQKELIEVARKRRTLEILKDREIQEHRNKLKKIEIEQLDEAAARRARSNL